MTGKKPTQKEKKAQARKGDAGAEISRIYDFGNSAVLLTHPGINRGETVQGCFSGSWETRDLSRQEFEILSMSAKLILPAMDWQLKEKGKAVRVAPGSIDLTLSAFEVPGYLAHIFPHPNRGSFDARNRLYQAVFAMSADLSPAQSEAGLLELPPADVLLLTIGNVEADGSLTASGIGRIVSGPFVGLMFGCNHPTKKPKCGAVYPKDGRRCIKPKGHKGKHINKLRPPVSW